MLARTLTAQIASLKKSILLLGPRQVGKSTLCSSLVPDLTISLASEATFFDYKRDLRKLEREVAARKTQSLIVIDEIQRIPELLNTVQLLIDENPLQHRFILTGSSAKKLRGGGANLLPGRVLQRFMTPLLWNELGEPFDLDRALRVGMLPGIYLDEDEGEEVLKSYVDTYLREEIQAEGLSRNIGAFARLLDAVASVSGHWLNYSKLSSDTEINKETVRSYISILEDTLVLYRIGSFKKSGR